MISDISWKYCSMVFASLWLYYMYKITDILGFGKFTIAYLIYNRKHTKPRMGNIVMLNLSCFKDSFIQRFSRDET